MKIHLCYKGYIKIDKYKNDSLIEVPERCTINELISHLDISQKQGKPYVLVNDEPAWDSTVLKENDLVKLINLVAGG